MKYILFFFFLLSLAACHSHEEETGAYVVNISINKPTEGYAAIRNQALPIEVVLSRADNTTIHNVKIDITDSLGNVTENLINKHYHQKGTVNYTENAYVPRNTGSFRLRVVTTDDNMAQPNSKEVRFSVN